MQATSLSFHAPPARRNRWIAATVGVLAVLAIAAALLEASDGASWMRPRGAQAATSSTVPVGIVGEAVVAGDPSVPSAASVFKDGVASPAEQVDTF